MIPSPSSPVWRKIATGQIKIRSSRLSLSILAANLQRDYELDSSEANVQNMIENTHEFFTRHENHFRNELEELLKS
jgi:hypothetical protein